MTQSQATAQDFWQMDSIITTVLRALGIDIEEFKGTGRRPAVVFARGMVAVLARETTALSYPEIARAMGRPSHSVAIACENRMLSYLGATIQSTIDIGGEVMTVWEFYRRMHTSLGSSPWMEGAA